VNTPVLAVSDADILRCFPVMLELRTHLVESEFLERVRRQQRESRYEIAFIEDQGSVKALAGFRVTEFLAWGKIMYVDDLVTTASARSEGHGGRLCDWLVTRARASGCKGFIWNPASNDATPTDFTCASGWTSLLHFELRLK